MTNKTTAAIEEAAKLPTAYQTLNYHLSRVGLTLATAHESILLDAVESHTAAHTAALRERVKELEEGYKVIAKAWKYDTTAEALRTYAEVVRMEVKKALK